MERERGLVIPVGFSEKSIRSKREEKKVKYYKGSLKSRSGTNVELILSVSPPGLASREISGGPEYSRPSIVFEKYKH